MLSTFVLKVFLFFRVIFLSSFPPPPLQVQTLSEAHEASLGLAGKVPVGPGTVPEILKEKGAPTSREGLKGFPECAQVFWKVSRWEVCKDSRRHTPETRWGF